MAPSKRHADGEKAYQGGQKRIKVVGASERVTRTASRDSTVDAVFLTTELLENILENLPMKDLLLAQRVSQKWKGVIRESTTLQQMLFYKPKEADFCWELDTSDVRPAPKWPKKVPTTALSDPLRKDVDHLVLFENGYMNPMVFITAAIDVYERAGEGGGTIVEPPPLLRHPSILYPEASWRKMLASQPPITSCSWEGEHCSSEGSVCFDVKGSLDLERYITCQDLCDGTGNHFETCCYLGIAGVRILYPLDYQLEQMLAEQDVMVD